MSKRSDIWNNFESVVDGKARCKHCRIDIGCKGGSTSSLWKHLESKHTHALTPKLQSTSGESSTKGQGSSSYTVSGIFAYCLSVNNLGCPVINHFGSELLVVIENKLTAKRNVEIVFITCKRT